MFLVMFLGIALGLIQVGDTGSATIIISEHTVYENQTIDLQENISVETNGTLVIQNCMVLMNGSQVGDINISVEKGGELHIVNSTFQRRTNESYYHFFIEGEVQVESAEFNEIGGLDNNTSDHFGWNYTYGFMLQNVTSSKFEHVALCNSSGITLMSFRSNFSLNNIDLITARSYAMKIVESNLSVQDISLTFKNWTVYSYGIYLLRSDVSVEKSTFIGLGVSKSHYLTRAVASINSTVTVSFCTFLNLRYGVSTFENSDLFVNNCTFENNYYGVYSSTSQSEIRDSLFIDNEAAIYFHTLFPFSKNNTFLNHIPRSEAEFSHSYNYISFFFKVKIQVNVYLKGDPSKFHSHGWGVEVIQDNGHVVENSSLVSGNYGTGISSNDFTNYSKDILSTPLKLKAYWYNRNESFTNTTLGELLNGGQINLSLSYYPEKFPDLRVPYFSMSKTHFRADEQVMITAIIENGGDKAAQSIKVSISVYYGNEIYTEIIPELAPGDFYELNYLWDPERVYPWFDNIKVTVDSDYAIKEHDEHNNTAQLQISIEAGNKPPMDHVADEEFFFLSLLILIGIGIFCWSPWKKDDLKKK